MLMDNRMINMIRTAKAKRLMKIGELSQITGVARDSIHYYIREGLLPEPVRTKKNMAYYDQVYVERIKLIKEIQEKRFLPLHVIKQILAESERNIGIDEIKTLLELDGKLFKNMETSPEFKPLTLAELVERSGLPSQEIERLKELDIISARADSDGEFFDEDSVRVVEIWAKMRQSGFSEEIGFSLDLLQIHKDLMEVLARKEIEIFTTRVTGKVSEEVSIRMAEMGIQLMNSLICLMRKRTILRVIRDYGMQS
jgi:DNA-binding transcriptional MerR regulator